MSTVESVKPVSAIHARRMGVTLLGLRRKAKELKRAGIITDDMDRKEISQVLAEATISENDATMAAFEECLVEDGRDWESFFAALAAFIEKIMPLILMFL